MNKRTWTDLISLSQKQSDELSSIKKAKNVSSYNFLATYIPGKRKRTTYALGQLDTLNILRSWSLKFKTNQHIKLNG